MVRCPQDARVQRLRFALIMAAENPTSTSNLVAPYAGSTPTKTKEGVVVVPEMGRAPKESAVMPPMRQGEES